ncbi:hypothetical protein HNP82_003209 [Catenibacillus scindens]|uniref:Uncharacterized protein n=1 Tax=Catenibacillus scindens TaxID=673271 RepID=A0A7W8HD06_9FIRM|nr:hypothetical protein [Catenibacillus scindens]MBB5266055.1 hypothetical protein [Catenibacillus scindens]
MIRSENFGFAADVSQFGTETAFSSSWMNGKHPDERYKIREKGVDEK